MLDLAEEETEEELASALGWIHQYHLFDQAKYLGIQFGPKDIGVETIRKFSIIKSVIDESIRKRQEAEARKSKTRARTKRRG